MMDIIFNYSNLKEKIAYHRALSATVGPVRAEGKVVSIGRRVAFAEARITDEAGRLYASAASTLQRLRRCLFSSETPSRY